MDRVTVLLTGSGAPGAIGTIYALKNNPEGRKVKIIEVDLLIIVVESKPLVML